MTFRSLRPVLLLAALVLLVMPAGPVRAAVRAPSAAPNCGPAVAKTIFTKWQCTFADDFDGTALDPGRWTPITTAANGATAGADGCFTDSANNISVSGGYLMLTARQEPAPITCQNPRGSFTTSYTSGQVATYGRFSQQYGRFAVRARFPAATVAGLQSTLWMWPQSNLSTGLTGEVDFAEWYSYQPNRVVPYLHYPYVPQRNSALTHVNTVTNSCVVADTSAFHVYAVEWTSTTFTVTIDNQLCLSDKYQPWGGNPFAQPYFLALTQALGVGYNAFQPGVTPLPATTTIDWVRAWK
jgi:beta-glucanase (GH16 family)